MADRSNRIAQQEVDLAAELLRIHQQSYGKGAERARARIFDDMVVLTLDGLELQPNEKFMIEAGKGDTVLEVRAQYQQAIESTFRAAVERGTGRTVVSFASNTKLDPNYSVEIFRLAPSVDSGLVEVEDG